MSSKKDKVLKSNKKGFRIEFLVPVLILVVGVVVVFMFMNKDNTSKANFGNTGVTYVKTKAKNGVITLDASQFSDYKARYYTHKLDGTDVFFFVVKSNDEVIRAAFDACDVCFRERKGYKQDGFNMTCNNCGMSFPSNKINDVKGGCNPAPLKRSADGKYLTIKVDDLTQGTRFFSSLN